MGLQDGFLPMDYAILRGDLEIIELLWYWNCNIDMSMARVLDKMELVNVNFRKTRQRIQDAQI